MADKKNILITGASGFIGGYIIDEALKREYNIFVTARKTTNTKKLQNKGIKNIIEVDFSDQNNLENIFTGLPKFDFIIHNAGITKAFKNKEYFEINFHNTVRFIEALKKIDKVPRKFIFMGSLAAYGPGKKNSSKPVKRSQEPKPVTKYGVSKLKAERYIVDESGINYIIFSPTAVYGPGEKDLFTTIKLINKGIDFKIGFKTQYFTFLYVKDLAKLVIDSLDSPIVNKEYFVSDGNLYTKKDLSRAIKKNLGVKAIPVTVPVWFATIVAAINEGISWISGKQSILNVEKIAELSAQNLNCDIEDLKKDLNFKPEYDLYKGMKESIDWYKKQGWL
ncbi:MAG TPA: NAD(P)-dependent oxidoreductase [Bacteroidetes bacterium]|nr:NAD(P)-dependent oxidoreductase [Bacteroidota bacterium]